MLTFCQVKYDDVDSTNDLLSLFRGKYGTATSTIRNRGMLLGTCWTIEDHLTGTSVGRRVEFAKVVRTTPNHMMLFAIETLECRRPRAVTNRPKSAGLDVMKQGSPERAQASPLGQQESSGKGPDSAWYKKPPAIHITKYAIMIVDSSAVPKTTTAVPYDFFSMAVSSSARYRGIHP